MKYGPEVHYGVGRHGTHLGIGRAGSPTAHIYRDRIYTGDSKKGETISLTEEEKKRAARLIRKYRRTR